MVSETLRADMLLDCAKITEDQQLMIKTACPDGGFDNYAGKLKEHHGSIQEKEKRRRRSKTASPAEAGDAASDTVEVRMQT